MVFGNHLTVISNSSYLQVAERDFYSTCSQKIVKKGRNAVLTFGWWMEETSSQDAYEKWLIQSHLFIMTRDELRSFQRNLTAILAKSYCSGGIPTWIFWLWALRKYFFERAKHHYLPKTLRVPFMEFVLRANAATLHSGSWPRLLPVRIGLK